MTDTVTSRVARRADRHTHIITMAHGDDYRDTLLVTPPVEATRGDLAAWARVEVERRRPGAQGQGLTVAIGAMTPTAAKPTGCGHAGRPEDTCSDCAYLPT